MEIINKITFDMAAAGMPPYIDAVQGDTLTRKVEVTLMTRGQVFDPSDGFVSVSVAFKKPDGTAGWYDTMPDGSSAATVISDGVYQVSLAPEMFTVPGSVYALFRFDLDGQTISTFPFFVRVSENPSFNSSKSENYYNVQTWDSVNASFDEIFDRLAELEQGGGSGAGIDDENISTETTWSSQNIVDKLCPSFNESGATVTCEPLEGLPLEVVSHFVPKQAGSGDPSLTNIRPITGYDSIKLSHTGKNLFGGEALADVIAANGGEKDAAAGTILWNPASLPNAGVVRLFDNFKENTQYTFIFYGRNTTGATNDFNLWVNYTDGTYSNFQGSKALEDARVVVTSNAGKTISSLSTIWFGGATLLHYEQCGIFEGEISALDFEPYNNNSETFTIDLGQTVYGGTYNWHTGHLSVSYASIVFDGVTSGKKVLSTDSNVKTYAYFAPIVKANASKTIYSDRAKCTAPGAIVVHIPKDVTGVTDSDDTTSVVTKINATLKSWYDAGTPLTCVYEVETPTSIQLTPQEILALSGTNVLSSNTGNTEVKGKAVADSVIQDLYNKLNALTATLTALTGV
jgi:hypothetical protein